MKYFFLLALLVPSSFAFAQPDLENTKLRILSITGTEDQQPDCKLSLREIKKFDGHSVGKRYLCAQLVDFNNEISMTKLKELIQQGKVKLLYQGDSADSLLATFSAWRGALLKYVDDYVDPEFRLSEIQPWSFKLVSRNANVVTINLSNAKTGDSVIFSVTMNSADANSKRVPN